MFKHMGQKFLTEKCSTRERYVLSRNDSLLSHSFEVKTDYTKFLYNRLSREKAAT